MCEFKIFLNEQKVFEDVVYLTFKNGKVVLKTILGETKEIENCQIAEVNVSSEKIVLVPKN